MRRIYCNVNVWIMNVVILICIGFNCVIWNWDWIGDDGFWFYIYISLCEFRNWFCWLYNLLVFFWKDCLEFEVFDCEYFLFIEVCRDLMLYFIGMLNCYYIYYVFGFYLYLLCNFMFFGLYKRVRIGWYLKLVV